MKSIPWLIIGLVSSFAFSSENQKYEDNLMTKFRHQGFIVVRNARNAPIHIGDSGLWTGLAMGVLPCAKARILFETLANGMEKSEGAFLRHYPLTSGYRDNPTSRDMEAGALFGFTLYAKRCRDSRVKKVWQQHIKFITTKGKGRLHPDSPWERSIITPAIAHLLNEVSHYLTGENPKIPVNPGSVETTLVIDAQRIVKRKNACYPLHLSTLFLYTLNTIGKPVSKLAKRQFCLATKPAKLPLTDLYCNRLNAKSYLATYQSNQWIYRHQRCHLWESKDLLSLESSASLDWLMVNHLANSPVND